MKKIRILMILWGIFFIGTNFTTAQVYHESFENFDCEYDCNTPCHNYFYDECIPNWFSANYQPQVLKNSCNTVESVNASDGEYFSGTYSLGRFIFFELSNQDVFEVGQDYFMSCDVYNSGGQSLFLLINGYNDLINVNDDTYNGDYIHPITDDISLFTQDVWLTHNMCFTVGTESFNQLLFEFEAITGGGQGIPSGECYDPFVFLDNVKIICQQDYDINEISNDLDINLCKKSRTFELVPLGTCENDLTDYPYTVELYKQGELVNSFTKTGNEFTLEFDLFDGSEYTIKVQDLNSDECGYTTPTKTVDLDADFIQDTDITGVTTWDTPQITNKNIFVKTGGFLTITNQVVFSPDSRIIVERGAKLVLDHGHLTTCADQWSGVIVNGNSNLDQPDPNGMPGSDEAGIIITKNRSIIEKAHIGISTDYYGSWSADYWGGLVQCTNTDFIGCWKAVEFMKYEKSNNSFIEDCRIGGGDGYTKEGITIWACKGILIDNCYIHDLVDGVFSIDADYKVWNNNIIENCEWGIRALAGSNGIADIDVRYENHFNNNDDAIVLSGNTGTKGGKIDGNYFEGNWRAIEIDGDDNYSIKNNNFTNSGYTIGVWASDDHPSFIECNDMIVQQDAVSFAEKNESSTFLSNTFEGSGYYGNGSDVVGYDANIDLHIGEEYNSAKNTFSGFTNEINWDNSNDPFNYHILKFNPPPNTIPHSEPGYDNYNILSDVINSIDPPRDCSTVDPPTVTENEVIISIKDYCNWLNLYRQNPKNPYYRWKFLQAKKKLLSQYYYWVNQSGVSLSVEQIEAMLEKLCDDRWKVTLYGHYMKYGLYSKADSLLNVLENPKTREVPVVPEDLTDESRESFIRVQRINLKYQLSNGSYQLTQEELETLQTEAVKPIPESAYAKGLYLLVTGIYIPRQFDDRIQNRSIPKDVGENFIENWSVYPNPTNNILYIDYSSKEEFEGKIIIYDLLGSKILETLIKFMPNSEKKLDVSSLKNGVYILIVKNKVKNVVKTQKIIINSVE